MSHSKRKYLVKAELRFWSLVEKARENASAIVMAAALVGALAAVVLLSTSFLATSAPASSPSASPVATATQHPATPPPAGHHHSVQPPVAVHHHHVARHARAFVIVKAGDTLWGIAGKYLHNPYKWTVLAHKNAGHISNPSELQVGERVWL